SEFLTINNWKNIFSSMAVVYILAIGMTFVVISGGIDLSVGSMTVAVAMIFGITVRLGLPWLASILIAIFAGLILGLINGVLIGKFKITFFVVTLGTLSIFQSFALLSTSGETISLIAYPNFETIQPLLNTNIGLIP